MSLARAGIIALVATLLPSGAIAQQRFVPGDTVLIRPARQYEAGGLQRWLLGDGYRELWSIEVPVEVLDLATYAGGLEPLQLGGGQQTQSIRFQGADGLIYNFRSVDKNARRGLDPVLQASLAADVMQDQISSLMPLSAMVVAHLLDAAELFHPQPRLVVMPDDPALGEHQEAFAGVLGWIELRPDEGQDDTPGFAGSERVIGSDRLYERLEEEPDNLVDQRAFLKARYVDFLVGDWDRHPDQWRWAGFPDRIGARDVTLFQPVPRDRDWALARLDGVIQTVASVPYPQYVGFSHDYPAPIAASWNGRGLDRRLMSELDSADFAEVADEVVAAISDDVIEAAVRLLPEAYYRIEGPTIERNLKNRRNELTGFAERYYDLLAEWVDVEATDEDELLLIERGPGGTVTLTIYDLQAGEPRAEPYYRRTFTPSHTREIRLYANGGDDRIEVSGSVGPIRVRVIGGGGDDEVVDATNGAELWVYDHRGDNDFSLGRRATLDESDWEAADDPEAALHGARSRDWGAAWLPLPALGANPDDGIVLGLTVSRSRFDFRHFPWADRFEASASIGTATWQPNFGLSYRMRTPDRRLGYEGRVAWFGSRADRFYGFGNSTEAPGDDDAFRARRSELRVTARALYDAAPGVTLSFGSEYRWYEPEENEGTLVESANPYGYSDFALVDLVAGATLDLRDDPWIPRSGIRLEATAGVSPALLEVTDAFGYVEGSASAYLSSDSLPLAPSLAVRAQGRRVFGTYPYFAAATLGGNETLRGFRSQRFAGDSSLSTSVELRGALDDFLVLFPGQIGLLGLVDTGRVWFDGESSSAWHTAVGGGVWISLVDAYSGSLVVARSDEETGLYLTFGLPF